MSLTITQGIPATLTAGDAASFKVTDPNYPASVWTATQILFKNGTNTVRSFDATASGDDFLFALTNAHTATLFAGPNRACLVFSDGTNRQTSDWTSVEVLPDPTAKDAQTFAQKQVELLQGVIAKFNATDKSSVSFNGQTYQRANLSEYQKQLVYYEARVIREKARSDISKGIATSRRVPFQFVNQ